MNKILGIILLLPLLLSSCDSNIDVASLGIIPSKTEQSRGMNVVSTCYNNDSTQIYLYLSKTIEAGQYDYTDPEQVKIKVKEHDYDMTPVSLAGQPTLQSFTNIGIQQLQQAGLVVNVLIDLTQPVSVLNQQRDHVYKMSKDLCRDNLYLTFMYAFGKRSQTMLATPYIIENYISRGQLQFTESDSIGLPYIYRTVNSVVNEMVNGYDEKWQKARYKALLVFSDGIVYDGDQNLPLDPQHFQMQLQLVQLSRHFQGDFTVSYVSLTPQNIDPNIVDVNMMKMLCNRAHGQFYESFEWETVKNDLKATFNIRYPDYLATLDNPHEKIYSGNKRYLKLTFTTPKDSLLAQSITNYSFGSVYSQICIGPYTLRYILLKGVVYGGLLLLLVYFIVQIIVPYVMYRLFRKKCVARYRGRDMVLNTFKVPATCYYCKAPFKVGEFIVAKCNHVMHEDCWNENDYHCPEHGTQCPDGSHYYNQHNLLDPKNSLFYLKWILVSTIAGMLAWVLFITIRHDMLYHVMEDLLCAIFNISNPNDGMVNPFNISIMTARMYMLPGAGVYISFILTLFISILTTHHTKWNRRIVDILVRAVSATVLTFLTFAFENFVIVLGQLYDYEFFLDWIPWTLSAVFITIVSTLNSRVKLHHKRILIAAAGGFISTLLWVVFGNIDTVNEVLLLIVCNVIYALSVALSVARDMPRSEHYFLHVTGDIKEMDIALFKWLRQSPESVAYIGRSVDCHLQITWDTLSDIAPVHAAVSNDHGVPQLSAVDGVVYLNDKPIQQDRVYSLYHGDTFQIGLTTFKFMES